MVRQGSESLTVRDFLSRAVEGYMALMGIENHGDLFTIAVGGGCLMVWPACQDDVRKGKVQKEQEPTTALADETLLSKWRDDSKGWFCTGGG